MLSLFTASQYTEFYLDKKNYLIPISFYLYGEYYIEYKYINALDVITCLGYVYPDRQWEVIKTILGKRLGVIECTLTGEIIDGNQSIILTEDYLTYPQVELVVESTTKISKREKNRLLNFIRNSI
ncbi:MULTISPECIES: hypothetical protein [Calothrix]|uniref:Uncharacterized protein n=2 Tax=Calothrix TaxID=1186 RepID=A0ABR8AJH6_9CYAN|nr:MULTISPECIES: hypothetical protein [Calothrix]MBD2199939.1 hypothetical protein [Calothrix parietina FACHB-288]MBD2228854.1 hypothetical protein [Calothrix anomala FACHB-343]